MPSHDTPRSIRNQGWPLRCAYRRHRGDREAQHRFCGAGGVAAADVFVGIRMAASRRHGGDRDRHFVAADFLAGVAVVDPVFAVAGAAGTGFCILAQPGTFDAGHRRRLFFDAVGTKKIWRGLVMMKIDSASLPPL